MIQWLRDKFASAITFFFVLGVIITTIGGGIAGYLIGKALGGWYNNYGGIGCVIGLVLGLFLGIVFGILTFGYFATVIHISESIDSKMNLTNEPNSSAKIPDMDDIQAYQTKEEWISNRIMKLTSVGLNPSDSKVQAETEYNLEKIKLDRKNDEINAKQQKMEKLKNSLNGFVYDEHLETFNSLSNVSELIDYLKRLEIKDEYFNEEILPKIEEYKEQERLYGNMLKSALIKLQELTKK